MRLDGQLHTSWTIMVYAEQSKNWEAYLATETTVHLNHLTLMLFIYLLIYLPREQPKDAGYKQALKITVHVKI
jgi:hypothetical protein